MAGALRCGRSWVSGFTPGRRSRHRFAVQRRDRPEHCRVVVTVGFVDAVSKSCGRAFFVDIPTPGHIAENAVRPEVGGTVAALVAACDRVDMADDFRLMAVAIGPVTRKG